MKTGYSSLLWSFSLFFVLWGKVNCQQPAAQVDDICLGCICEAISNCTDFNYCDNGVCGLLRITYPYWVDANKPTIKLDTPDTPDAFKRCVTDPQCAADAVRGYMAKYGKDCTGDQVVNCYDYARIHKLGAYSCNSDAIEPIYWNRFTSCYQQAQQFGR